MQDRLLRSRTDRVIGGVCGGLGAYFEIDPVIVRLLFVLLALGGGLGVVLYLVLWVVVPHGSTGVPGAGYQPGAQPGPGMSPAPPPSHASYSSGAGAGYDPASFRYDPYTGQPIQRVGERAEPQAAPSTGPTVQLRGEEAHYGASAAVPPPAPPAADQLGAPPAARPRGDRRSQLGMLLLIVGALALASEFGIDEFFFPALLIIGGLLLISRR